MAVLLFNIDITRYMPELNPEKKVVHEIKFVFNRRFKLEIFKLPR